MKKIKVFSAICALCLLASTSASAAPAPDTELSEATLEEAAVEEVSEAAETPAPVAPAGIPEAGPFAGEEAGEIRYGGEILADNGLLYEDLGDGTLRCVGLAEENREPESVTVPETVRGMTVTEIGARAFEDADTLLEARLPDSARAIRESAFEHCNNLKTLRLAPEMDVIEARAFYMCGLLEDFELPRGLTEIADGTFFACDRLNVVRIPEGVERIGDHAYFSNMYLHTVELPSTLVELGDWSFGACENLKTINIPASLKRIGKAAFNFCWQLPAPTLPQGLETVEDQAFEGCAEFRSIDLPASVRTIGAQAFEGCAELREVNILGRVTHVGARAFAFCLKLPGLYFPDGLLSIGAQAFEGAALTADLPVSLVSIGDSAFDTEGCTILYKGSPSMWSRVVVGAGNDGISSVEFAVPDGPGDAYEPRLAPGSDLELSTLPGSTAPVLLGLAAGRTAPTASQAADAFLLSPGESARVLSPDGDVLMPEDPCGTGSVVQFSDAEGVPVERVFVVVKGDLLGTGRISIAQLVRMANGLIDETALSALELMAADFNGSGRLDIGDVVIEARMLAA